MTDYSHDDMVDEFGEPGVQNPNVLDLVQWDEDEDRVVLVMQERRTWGPLSQLQELEEKINRYLGFALEGFLAEQFPQYEGKPVALRLDCVEEPSGDVVAFLEEARAAIEGEGLAFEVAKLELQDGDDASPE